MTYLCGSIGDGHLGDILHSMNACIARASSLGFLIPSENWTSPGMMPKDVM